MFLQLPSFLKRLEFGENFKQPLSDLPESLETLIFGFYYIQPLPNPLPSSLTRYELRAIERSLTRRKFRQISSSSY